MNTIKLSPELMRQRASEYKTYNEEIKVVKQKVYTVVEQLKDEWQGVAALSFENKINENITSFNNLINLLDLVTLHLNNSASAYEETDANIARQLNL